MSLTPDEHIKRAKYNESFARWLGGDKSKWPSWTMTAVFYSALHAVDALFAARSVPTGRHKIRNNSVVAFPDLRKPYMRLFDYGHQARYLGKDHDQKRLAHALALLDDVKHEVRSEWPSGLNQPQL